MLTFPVGLLSNKESKILVTMTPTAGFTVGFNLTFTGSVFIDFKDGGGKEALTSGVEKTHLYAGAGTYIAEITGDISNITRIVADTSRITDIDVSLIPTLANYVINSNLLSGVINLPVIIGTCSIFSNSGVTNISIPAGSSYNQFIGRNCNLTGTVDFSGIPTSGNFIIRVNSLLTGLTFATSGNGTCNSFSINSCNITGILNLINKPIGGNVQVNNNTALTDITFSNTGNTALTSFNGSVCALTNLDFTKFPTSDGVTIQLQSNSMTATEHDNQLINLDSTGWINGNLTITSGNTARTSASDTAYNNLIANGWTIT